MTEVQEMKLIRGRRPILPDMPFAALPELLMATEVAAWAQVTDGTVYRWIHTSTPRRRKRLKTTRVGGRPMIRKADLKEFLKL